MTFVKTNIDKSILVKSATDLLQLPKIIYVNKFNEETSKTFSEEMSAAENTGQPIIPIYIDSYGGEVYSLLFMIDVIKRCKTPVATIALGKAMSCGSVLLSQGTEGFRFVSENSAVMIHDVSSGSYGKTEDLKIDVTEAERLKKLIFKLMAESTGHKENFYIKKLTEKHNVNWYLTPQQAVDLNIANTIGVPKFDVSVKVEYAFGKE